MRKTALWAYLAVAGLVAGLYLPFLSNGLIFDDHNIFAHGRIYDLALTVIDLRPRTFPYFTLGFIQVVFEAIEYQRLFNIILHLAVCGVLMLLCLRLPRLAGVDPDRRWMWSVIVAVGMFALHPLATYGVGYLAQRSILFATLFSLLSLIYYSRSLQRESYADTITAAFFYALAVFSKEHAVLLPAVVVLLSAYIGWSRAATRALVYVVLCLPSVVVVYLALRGVVGAVSEPDAQRIVGQVLSDTTVTGNIEAWSVSVGNQALLFFRYLYLWLIPDPRLLSIDNRVDLYPGSDQAILLGGVFAYCIFGIMGAALLVKGGRLRTLGYGILYFWVMFLVEFSSTRFQEPFVLYRSYLWAPGLVIAVACVFARLQPRMPLVIAAMALGPLLFLAHDRLSSMESELSVWDDAVRKLSSPTVHGADRAYYNRGIQRVAAGHFEEAVADLTQVIVLDPQLAQAYEQRGAAYLGLSRFGDAKLDFEHALSLQESGWSYYGRGFALEQAGCTAAALRDYQAASDRGVVAAQARRHWVMEQEKEKGQAPVKEACPD